MMHKFEIGQKYANRKDRYTVLEIYDDTILVELEDGTRKRLNAASQWRIYQNMLIEQSDKVVEPKKRRPGQPAKSTDTFSLWEDIVPFVSKHLYAADDWLSSHDLHVAFLETEEGKAVLRNVQQKRDMAGKPKDSNENIAKNMVAFFHKSWTEENEQLRQQFDRMEIEGVNFYRRR
jgi:hypothetical protein